MKEKIYMIPGLMTDERLWKRLIPFLEKDYDLVHISIPLSSDFDEIVDILFNKIKDEKINLLGFSLGGYIASYFAVTYPQRVKRLFLVASTPGSSTEAEVERRKKKFSVIEKDGFEGLSYEKAKSLLEEKNQSDEELIQIIRDMYVDLGEKTFVSQLTSTFYRKDLFEDLKIIDIPFWFYYSTEDRLLNKRLIEKIIEVKYNINLISRVGTSHNIPLEFPKELSIEIKNWMNEK
jgi:pimeloyl-ACP methyl ester carboxylesterase